MQLPPPRQSLDLMSDEDTAAITSFADGVVLECAERRTGRDEQARRNYNLYLGNHWLTVAPDESYRYVFNRIKTIVMAHAAIQNGQRPQVTFSPRQSGDPGLGYVNLGVLKGIRQTPEIVAILQQIPPQCLMNPPMPLPQQVTAMLNQAIEQGQLLTERAQMLRLPAPVVIPEELLVKINDDTACEALQMLFDSKWDECDADYFMLTDSFYNNIIGWSHMSYQWDKLNQRHKLFNCEFPQVFLDPMRPDIRQSQTAVWDHIMSADEGAADYPNLAQFIQEHFTPGRPIPAGTYLYRQAAVYDEVLFRRKMGVVRKLYARNQPYPMTPEQAMAAGLVEQRQVPIESTPDAVAGDTSPVQTVNVDGQDFTSLPDESDKQFAGAEDVQHTSDNKSLPDSSRDSIQPGDERSGSVDVSGNEESSQESPQAAQPQIQEPQGGPLSGTLGENPADNSVPSGIGVMPAPALRVAYFLTGTDTEIEPWGEGWPTRLAIREITIIATTVVEDKECEYADINLTHNVNFPIPYTPWGQGTPEDLEPLNLAVNSILSDMIQHIFTTTYPTQIIPDSVNNRRSQIAQDSYVKPGTRLLAPDDMFEKFKGELIHNLMAPEASADLWKGLAQILDLMDKQGDMAQVLQGQASPGWSGNAIGKLQGAAQGSILFRSRRCETMLKYLVTLMNGAMIKNMTPQDIASHLRKYPVYIWDAFATWWKDRLAYDIHVEITSGGGANKMAKTAQTMQALQMGVQVSQPSILESLGLDPESELQKALQWNRKLAAAQGAGMPAQGTEQQQPPQGQQESVINAPASASQ